MHLQEKDQQIQKLQQVHVPREKDDVIDGLQEEVMHYYQGTVVRERSNDEALSTSKSGDIQTKIKE